MADTLMVVVSWNSIDLTRACVESLQRQVPAIRFVVWDNASEDGTAGMLADLGVEHVASPTNLYWTPAINRAIETFWQGETCIGWMNNDATLTPLSAQRMAEVLRRRPEIGLVAPVTSNIGGPQDVASNQEAHDILHKGPKFPDKALEQLGTKRCTYVLGACSMTRKDVWDTVGPLDERMALGADDHDISRRVTAYGYEIHVVQSAYCHHKGHASNKSKGGRKNWEDIGAISWAAHDTHWAGYYATEEEAVKCHWTGAYHGPEWEIGTGWSDETLIEKGLPTPAQRDEMIRERLST